MRQGKHHGLNRLGFGKPIETPNLKLWNENRATVAEFIAKWKDTKIKDGNRFGQSSQQESRF